jgi:hypothetical protein
MARSPALPADIDRKMMELAYALETVSRAAQALSETISGHPFPPHAKLPKSVLKPRPLSYYNILPPGVKLTRPLSYYDQILSKSKSSTK